MGKEKDLTGQRFGKLIALERTDKKRGNLTFWKCQCDCGNISIVQTGHLTNGHTQSCGCLQKERARKAHTTHGKANERITKIWYGIRKRCYNPNSIYYSNYGGRGISMCDEWRSDFQSFYEWAMSHGYEEHLTIDRIDVNGNYCPENCRWITNEEQQNNRRTSHLLTYNGETHSMKDWAQLIGIKYSTLRGRINVYKWDVEKALTTGVEERS